MTSRARQKPSTWLPDALRLVPFRRFWTAQTVSFAGDQVTVVALPLTAVLTLHATPIEMGLLAAMASAPAIAFSLYAGAFVDRRGRRRWTMIATDAGRAALLTTVPLAYWLGVLTLAQLYVVAFATGSLAVISNICATSLWPALVPRERYVEATSLVRGSYSFSWVAGPPIAGALVQALSGPVAIVADAASFVGSALLLRSTSLSEPTPEPANRGHIREGLRFVWRTPALRGMLTAGTCLNGAYSVYFALLFLFGSRELHLAAGVIGLALGAGAVGAVLGSVVAGWTTRRIGLGPVFMVGSFIYPAALLLVPLASGNAWRATSLLVTAEVVSGFGLMLCDISGSSIQQAITPDRLRSRVQGATATFTNGARPLGALAGGALGAWLGLRPTLLLAVVAGIASVLLLLPSPLPRMRELPAPAD